MRRQRIERRRLVHKIGGCSGGGGGSRRVVMRVGGSGGGAKRRARIEGALIVGGRSGGCSRCCCRRRSRRLMRRVPIGAELRLRERRDARVRAARRVRRPLRERKRIHHQLLRCAMRRQPDGGGAVECERSGGGGGRRRRNVRVRRGDRLERRRCCRALDGLSSSICVC